MDENAAILRALHALADQLAATGEAAHLYVIGGAALVLSGSVARATNDVDVVALAGAGGALVSADPFPDGVQRAAARVAEDLGLQPDWLNAGPTGLLIHGLPEGFRERCTTVALGSLTVAVAAREDLIHLKLFAAADRGEPRDWSDLRALAPTPDELRRAARWARRHNMPGPFDAALASALAQFGVEDEGRVAE